jgi:hypothetical protein
MFPPSTRNQGAGSIELKQENDLLKKQASMYSSPPHLKLIGWRDNSDYKRLRSKICKFSCNSE